MITSLVNQPPIYFNIREESNCGRDFSDFILEALIMGYLVDGDYLILDNATVHRDSDNLPELITLLDAHNIRIIYLPTYSPELNPAELVFNVLKKHIRNQPLDSDLWNKITTAFSFISVQSMVEFYNYCLEYIKLAEKLDFIV